MLYETFLFRQKDLEMFLDHTRSKFVGFNVKNDSLSLAGLPLPIHEGVKVLKQVSVESTKCATVDLCFCIISLVT